MSKEEEITDEEYDEHVFHTEYLKERARLKARRDDAMEHGESEKEIKVKIENEPGTSFEINKRNY